MELPFSPELPSQSRTPILSESIRAHRHFEEAIGRLSMRHYQAEFEQLVVNFILRIWIVFVREATKLGQSRTWAVDRVDRESREFLRLLTSRTREELRESGHRIREMIHYGGREIHPEVYAEFRKSPEWKEFENALLELADREASSGPDIAKTELESSVSQHSVRERQVEQSGEVGPTKLLEASVQAPMPTAPNDRGPGNETDSTVTHGTAPAGGLDLASEVTRNNAIAAYTMRWTTDQGPCSEASLARTARVHQADLSKWKKGLLPTKSDKKARIENVLKGNEPPTPPARRDFDA